METLKELFARVLAIDKKEINNNSSLENTASWDSFNGLMLVSELEKNFDVKFTMDEVTSITKFTDIKDCLKKHGRTQGVDE
ncbi:acyl carrier protein [Candidatus Woesearchaeota archaeon]|nr:acyl carrier protein [Candidatus Woesearchaeota archaeon]